MKSPQGRELRAISARLRDEAQTLLDQANTLDVLAAAADRANEAAVVLQQKAEGAERLSTATPGAFVSHGVVFPEGTQLRLRFKGIERRATVGGGAIVANSTTYSSLSAAAAAVCGGGLVNGWDQWKVLRPGEAVWTKAAILRREEGGGTTRRIRQTDRV